MNIIRWIDSINPDTPGQTLYLHSFRRCCDHHHHHHCHNAFSVSIIVMRLRFSPLLKQVTESVSSWPLLPFSLHSPSRDEGTRDNLSLVFPSDCQIPEVSVCQCICLDPSNFMSNKICQRCAGRLKISSTWVDPDTHWGEGWRLFGDARRILYKVDSVGEVRRMVRRIVLIIILSYSFMFIHQMYIFQCFVFKDVGLCNFDLVMATVSGRFLLMAFCSCFCCCAICSSCSCSNLSFQFPFCF